MKLKNILKGFIVTLSASIVGSVLVWSANWLSNHPEYQEYFFIGFAGICFIVFVIIFSMLFEWGDS